MKSNTMIMILLAMAIVFPPPATALEASPFPVDPKIQTWLASASSLNENKPATHGNDPLRPVARFYQQVGFQPVWMSPEGLQPHGSVLLEVLTNAVETGLLPDQNLLPALETLSASGSYFSSVLPISALPSYLRKDVWLTDWVLQLAQHLSRGSIVPESLSRPWLAWRSASARDIPVELAGALHENRLEAYFESLHPKGKASRHLRKAMAHYESIKRSGGWPTIAPGPTLRMGDKGPRVETLKRRLEITADLCSDTPPVPNGYDASVEAAVKRFQRRHGIAVDGLVGRRTREELNVSAGERGRQIQINMERWRWLPDNLGDRYLMVNIPAFTLHIVDEATRVDTMRVIVGKNRRQTPVMSGRMTYLELNPYWNIPRKIARRDILPKVIGDPAYLVRQGIRIFASWDHQAREVDPAVIPWAQISTRHFPYRLRQDPSKVNALGQVKFIFPNHHSVYIHDTPGKTLFNRQERSFSSGCIRVETPLALAQYLLSEQGWKHSRLKAAVSQGRRQTVVLKRPIPVHLVYFTAWADTNGTVHFRKDIYKRDRELLTALEQTGSDMRYCGNDTAKNPLLAKCGRLKTRPIPTADISGYVRPPIEPAGKMAGNPMTGI